MSGPREIEPHYISLAYRNVKLEVTLSNWIDYQSIQRKLSATVVVCGAGMQLLDVGNASNQQHVTDTRSDA